MHCHAMWSRLNRVAGSRRGGVALCTQADKSSPRGAVHVAFCNYEAAINKFTNSALDPFGKILEFEYYAIQIRVGNEVTLQTSYRGGQILR